MPISATIASAFANLTISSVAKTLLDFGFTQAQIDAADRAHISCATNPVSYRYDGGVPTASVGHILATNGETWVEGSQNIVNLQFIRATASDGAVSITLEKF